MPFKLFFIILILTLSLLGCASKPPQQVELTSENESIVGEAVSGDFDSDEFVEPEEDLIEKFYGQLAGCEYASFKLRELLVGDLRVSNSDLDSISASLQVMGYNVLDLREPVFDSTAQYSCDELPLVTRLSQPDDLKVGFTDDAGGAESYGESAGGMLAPMGRSNASELDRFLVYYHPEQMQEFEKLQWVVASRLDKPSAQVYIETMVLEVREEDSKELGLQYSKKAGDKTLDLGGLIPGGDTLGYLRNTIRDPDTNLNIFTPGNGYSIQLRALIDEGKAEILSRPSVLAISNRQALIQVVDVIQTPIVQSTLSESGGLQVSAYEFEPLLIGITLNLKPRVSADRKWLTLEIDATVDSEDDENSGQVFAPTDTGSVLLAEKQGSSSKKVRTFARVPDRTPIVIGGLVGKTKEKREGKIPLLGQIPGIGNLFSSHDNEATKREIIIVLTPYILSEDAIGVRANHPNSDVVKKSRTSKLFKKVKSTEPPA